MPAYDYICPKCKVRKDYIVVTSMDDAVECDDCKVNMDRQFPCNSTFGAHAFPADGIFLEHVSPTGKLFHSKDEMRDFEKQTGTIIDMIH